MAPTVVAGATIRAGPLHQEGEGGKGRISQARDRTAARTRIRPRHWHLNALRSLPCSNSTPSRTCSQTFPYHQQATIIYTTLLPALLCSDYHLLTGSDALRIAAPEAEPDTRLVQHEPTTTPWPISPSSCLPSRRPRMTHRTQGTRPQMLLPRSITNSRTRSRHGEVCASLGVPCLLHRDRTLADLTQLSTSPTSSPPSTIPLPTLYPTNETRPSRGKISPRRPRTSASSTMQQS